MAIALDDKFALFEEHWSPKVIALTNTSFSSALNRPRAQR